MAERSLLQSAVDSMNELLRPLSDAIQAAKARVSAANEEFCRLLPDGSRLRDRRVVQVDADGHPIPTPGVEHA